MTIIEEEEEANVKIRDTLINRRMRKCENRTEQKYYVSFQVFGTAQSILFLCTCTNNLQL